MKCIFQKYCKKPVFLLILYRQEVKIIDDDNLISKFTELLASPLKPANYLTKGRVKVGAPIWGIACVSFVGLAGP